MKFLYIFLCIGFVLSLQKVHAQNKSIRFNGTSNYIEISNSLSSSLNFSADTFTIEAWVKPIVFAPGSNNYEHTIIGNDSGTIAGHGFVLRTGGSRKLNFAFNNGISWNNVVTTTSVFSMGIWTHVAVTKQLGNISLYVNGILASSASFPVNNSISQSNQTLKLGENGVLQNRKFNGNIDEVKIWKSARTQSEIQLDMIETCPSYPVELLAYYKLNDTTVPTILCENTPSYNGIMIDTLHSENGAILYQAGVVNLYVDSSNVATGCGTQNGYTWASAFSDLNAAILYAQHDPAIEKIFVAKGTYYPTHNAFSMGANRKGIEINSTSNHDKTFHIRTGLEVYGGYPSGGGIQDINLYETILDGSNAGGIITDTVSNVVFIDSSNYWAASFDTTKLIGFTIRNGHAELNGILNLSGGFGGGIYCHIGSTLIRENKIQQNFCLNEGAGIATNNCHCIIEFNRITNNAGAAISSSGGGISTYAGFNTIRHNQIAFNVNRFGIISNYGFTWIDSNDVYSNNGIAIYQNETAAKIKNNNIHHNRGTGIMIYYSDSTLISGNTISNNSTDATGGGMYLYGGTQKVMNNIIEMDTAGYGGGGAYMFNGDNYFYNNRIQKNQTLLSAGGGILCSSGHNSFSSNQIRDNIAHQGAGMYLDGGYDTVFNNMIIGNVSDYYGGGVILNSCLYNFLNNVVANNKASNAAGLEINGVNVSQNIVANNTFYHNMADTADVNGWNCAGLWLENGVNEINNNIFWDNQVAGMANIPGADFFHASGTNDFKYNSLQLPSSSYTSVGSGFYDIGAGAINNFYATDPLFLNLTDLDGWDNQFLTADDGLQLSSSSLFRNSGNNALFPNFISVDCTNSNRIDGTSIDLGAYELNCTPTNATPLNSYIICVGNSTTLTVNSSLPATSISWYGDSLSNVLIDTGYTYSTPILYSSDTLWVEANSCTTTSRIPVPVIVLAGPPSIINTSLPASLSFCDSSIVTLQVNSSALPDSVFWYSDSLSNTVLTTGYQYTTPSISSTDTIWVCAHGCDISPRIPIIVNVSHSGSFKQNITVCSPPYTWPHNGLTYNASGTYTYTSLTPSGCNFYDTLILNFTNLSAVIQQSGNMLTAQPSGAVYSWLTCNPYQLIPGSNSQTLNAISGGQFAVICSIGSCIDTSNCITVFASGINEEINKQEITLSPNPFNDNIVLQSTHNLSNSVIEVFDVLGRLILFDDKLKNNIYKIDSRNIQKGIYFIHLKQNGTLFTFKVLKE